jgi:hypothetical protein
MLSGSLETERLVLRPWREEDAVDLQRLFGDLAVRGGRDMSPDRIARLADGSVRQWRVNGFGPWAAIDKTTGRWIGRLGLDDLDDWPGRRQDRGRLRAASSLMGPRPRDRRRPGGVALRLRAARPGPDHQCHRRGPHRRSPGDGEGRPHVPGDPLLEESQRARGVVCHRPLRVENHQAVNPRGGDVLGRR